MTELLRRVWGHWARFWFEPQAPHALALFRIGAAGFFLVYWLARAPHLRFLFTPEGVYLPMFTAPPGGLLAAQHLGDVIGWLTAPVPVIVTLALYSSLIASLLLLLVGWWTRAAAILHFLLFVYFYHVEIYTLNASADRLFLQIALLLCFCRCDEVISLRARRRRRSGLPVGRDVPFWPARLVALQVTLVYLGTGFNKLFAPPWHGGEVLYYSFIGYWGSELGFWIARQVPQMHVYDALVFATIAFELTSPIGLWVRRLQPWYFAAGFGFHLAIALTLQIWQFLAMPLAYLLFLDPARVRSGWQALVQRLAATAERAPPV